MAGLEQPSKLVVRAYYQNEGATQLSDEEWRPDDWRRPEFNEADRPAQAREVLTQWLINTPALIRAVRGLWNGGDRHHGGEAVAAFLDDLLYGGGKARLRSLDDRISVQLVADQMARRDFCRMDFGALTDDVAGVDL
ncbi:hypothetical protein AB0M39_41970 [Streptomyces sp. NPDC051907]|uniref:hypothetical protein n=1 Tax=Streptomyces sp. NPDC051907 TaxID=3155284 RepID=UPI00342C224E